MKAITCIIGPAALLLFLSGCGQSGPLYLPGDPSEIQQTPMPEEADEEKEAADER